MSVASQLLRYLGNPDDARALAGWGFKLAPSFDTVGWFARSDEDIARIHAVIDNEAVHAAIPDLKILLLEDTLHVCDPVVRTMFMDDLQRLGLKGQWLC